MTKPVRVSVRRITGRKSTRKAVACVTMAGVPRILQAMFEGIASQLKGGPVLIAHTVVGNVAEGRIGDALAEIQKRNADLEIGSYPGQRPDGTFRNAVVIRGLDRARLAAVAKEVLALIRSMGGEATDEPPVG